MEILRRFDWKDTLLTETEEQAVEDVLVEYHDIIARYRMDIGRTQNSRSNSHTRMIKLSTAKGYQCRST